MGILSIKTFILKVCQENKLSKELSLTREVIKPDIFKNNSNLYDEAIRYQGKEDLEKMKKEGRDWGGYVYNRTKIVAEKTDKKVAS